MRPQRTYIVAATPRTGSYLLCGGLEATGIAGRPSEAFTPDFEGIWRRLWSLDPCAGFWDYFREAIRYGTTSNGVYGLKIHWMHIARLAQDASFAGESADVLAQLFTGAVFVNIVRQDLRAQALSYLRALQTNEWWRMEGVVNDQRNGAVPVFDAAAIERLERELVSQQSAWERYFVERHIEPLVVEYEALTEDYRGQLARVLDFLGLDASAAATIPPPRLLRQADRLTAQWSQLMEAACLPAG
jgi:LPS sulfotransferase NodH